FGRGVAGSGSRPLSGASISQDARTNSSESSSSASSSSDGAGALPAPSGSISQDARMDSVEFFAETAAAEGATGSGAAGIALGMAIACPPVLERDSGGAEA